MKKSILFILFLFSVSCSVFGQIRMSGKVFIDSIGQTSPGTTIQIKGTTRGTMADIDGNFEIEVEDENDILVFRCIGCRSLEIIASETTQTIILQSKVILEDAVCRIPYYPLKINYWSGIFYNPYGISLSKFWDYSFLKRGVGLDGGYSSNFEHNSDFYGQLKTKLFKRTIYYKFQQTTFYKSEIENRITTHLFKSSSYLKFIKTGISYGISHQTFSKTGIENIKTDNYGIHLGLSKNIKYIGNISAKSFYWQDYWAWEANLSKDFKRKIHTAISYRQTTQDFKEINLTLGYIF
ncbi:carboxypeptidase-like regulatory domain-containing protein [Bernardetia sp. Wsw4-3y2]|uniref:carboxypeptidase-like regulatory domain-containing protein n=1 Tax=Bernardetia sp. Wsw4-3y2 TaxID=3127471 RepID=UPI0030CACDB1